MGLFKISGVEIRGICGSVPKKKQLNLESPLLSEQERGRVVASIGIAERRIADIDICTSDLCFDSARAILEKLQWNRDEIDILVVVTQTPDHFMPATACILQDRLGLSKKCLAFDVNLGCSGYVYGLSIISSLLSSSGLKKGLLLVGDTLSKLVSQEDRTVSILFGDAGTATALENTGEGAQYYNLNTDGGGKDAIIVPAGGFRKKVSVEDFGFFDAGEGIKRRPLDLVMDGVSVFNFTIREVVKNIEDLLLSYDLNRNEIDSFVFHQANKMINDLLGRRLKLDSSRVPSSLFHFGNTSSATIPITLCSQLSSEYFKTPRRLLLSGFGVGLSWGTVVLDAKGVEIISLREVE